MFKLKKILTTFLTTATCITLLAGCGNVNIPISTVDPNITTVPANTAAPAITPSPTEPPPDIDASTVDYSIPVWNALEIKFTSSVTYANPFDDATLDVVFTSPNGEQMKMPGFWDGDTTWKVRFSPTMCGVWTYKTICSDGSNTGLNGKEGKIGCNAYKGELAIYQHGFIKTVPNTRYFMYADGTPFFYLGDTHWSMPSELFNTSSVAGIPSQFKYLVDKRVEQGFTVYQSEPLGAQYDFSNGVTQADIKGLQDLDARFKYIADEGLVHANAEFFFVRTLADKASLFPSAYLDKLCRLWVARFGAYPVLWTTAQESDDDFYYESGNQKVFNAQTNPWKGVAAKMYEIDPYKHPLTAHQEGASMTPAKTGINASQSSFRDVVGHTWYGVQWKWDSANQINFALPKDYWFNGQGKVIINYESLYDHLATLEFGARQQGYVSFLNGMYGYGYGAEDIWLLNSNYKMDADTVMKDYTVTIQDKKVKWYDSINFPVATQLGKYMHDFFNSMEWWKLEPCFDDPQSQHIAIFSAFYSAATIGNQTYVVYLYNKTANAGNITGLESGKTYTAKWFNPRTGEYTEIASDIAGTGDKSVWKIPDKPDSNDWVFLAIMN